MSQKPAYPPFSTTPDGRIKLPKNEGPITDIASLRKHLQSALAVELSTIPLYLTGAWTVDPEMQGPDFPKFPNFVKSQDLTVSSLMMHVALEEMLHLCLVGNALRGIGGLPLLYDKHVIPEYPTPMLGRVPELVLHIRPATQDNVETFVQVELPEKPDSIAQPDEYNSLGQFYHAIKDGFETLQANPDLFDQDSEAFQFAPGKGGIWGPHGQVSGSGDLVQVTNYKSAIIAMNTIVVQGEGAVPDADFQEPSHWQIFTKLGCPKQTHTWEVKYKIQTDPATKKYKDIDPKIHQLSETFDAAYCLLLLTLQTLWSEGDKDNRQVLIGRSFRPIMSKVLKPLAEVLMGRAIGDEVAAACFNYYEFTRDGTSATQQFVEKLETAVKNAGDEDWKKALQKILDDVNGAKLVDVFLPSVTSV